MEKPGKAAKVSASSGARSTIEPPAASLRSLMDEGRAARGVDHPKLVKTMAGVELRLEAAIIGEARRGDLDREQDVSALHVLELGPSRIDDEVGFNEGVRAPR